MNQLRISLIVLTQLPILYFVAGARDMLWGFNQTDAGFMIMILFFLLVPLMNLTWIAIEVRRAVKFGWQVHKLKALLMPSLAILFFLESLAIDVYLLSQARM